MQDLTPKLLWLQEQAKALGGKWDRQQKIWLIRYGSIAGTAMEKLIVLQTMDNELF